MILLILLSGCCSYNHQVEYYKNLKIEIGNDICVSKKERLLQNIRVVTDIWEKDFKTTLPQLTVQITESKHFRCGGVWAWGCYRHKTRNIKIVRAKWSRIPSLYHEFCHAVWASRDVKHIHTGWPTWNRRGRQISNRL